MDWEQNVSTLNQFKEIYKDRLRKISKHFKRTENYSISDISNEGIININ
jgi:DNA polymerase III delta prime subunit